MWSTSKSAANTILSLETNPDAKQRRRSPVSPSFEPEKATVRRVTSLTVVLPW